ncbi:hypothetical protein SBOR_7875 [Sclerotinia borealis F-4128]|uniref:Mid2 domain-containing protein n=1 Tax=Sclerotinia borealis (strain F-4128) TaxID=1432307 RepID=W9CA35_SCLBF|nr:hypothetical protein SBOR_7875 [Sclerotinia borealis F-4128]
MEFNIFSLVFNIFILHTLPVLAQTYVSSTVWVVPDGNTADLSKTYTEGLTLQVTWNAVPEGYQFQGLSNLWITTWDYSNTVYSQLLTGNVNTNESGTYDWTITIPTSVSSKDAKYVLRFKNLSPEYSSSSPEVSSTGFLIINGVSSSSSTTSSAQTITSATSTSLSSSVTTTPVTSTAGIVTTPTASSTFAESSGLSGGAKAGIAVGVVGAALLIAGLAFLTFRRRHQKKSSHEELPTDPPTYYEPPTEYATRYPGDVPIAETGGHERAELQGS